MLLCRLFPKVWQTATRIDSATSYARSFLSTTITPARACSCRPSARPDRKFAEDFKQGAVRIVRETGKPIAQVARELGINEGTLGNCCAKDRRQRDGSDAALHQP